jgi:hypothetical protein
MLLRKALSSDGSFSRTVRFLGDEANAKAAAVLFTEGGKAAVSHMFTRSDGSTMSYSEVRARFG